MAKKNVTQLYWVQTEDHDEDCFIIADSERSACRFHEDQEGYDRGDSTAHLVTSDVPSNFALTRHTADWAPSELLQALGAEFSVRGDEEIVRIQSRTFWLGSFAPSPSEENKYH